MVKADPLSFDTTAVPANGSTEPRALLPGGAGAARPAGGTASVDVNSYLTMFARRRVVFGITFIAVFAAAAAYVLTQPRVYRATAKVQVVQPRPIIILTPGSGPADDHSLSLQTEAKKVQSWNMAQEASAISAGPEHRNPIPASEIAESVIVLTEEPDVLAISAESASPKRAADIANYVTEAYAKRSQDDARRMAVLTMNSLEKHRQSLQEDLRKADDEIKAFKSEHHIQDVDPAAVTRARSLVDYSAEADLARASMMAQQAELESLKSRLRSMRPTIPVESKAGDPVAAALQQEILDTQTELETARLRYDDQHPRVLALRDRLTDLRNRKAQRALERTSAPSAPAAQEPNPEYEALRTRIQDQEGQLLALRARAGALEAADAQNRAKNPPVPPNYLELGQLQRARDITEKAYSSVLEQINAQQANVEGTQGPANPFATAQPPERPIRPNPKQSLALAAVLAALAGLSLAYLKETVDQGVHEPDEILMRTGVMPLGFIAAARDSEAISTITSQSPRSSIAESFRMVHANLVFSFIDSPLHTIMVTSAAAGEGKTLVAANLAIVFAEHGVKTLLVEADLRRPKLHRTFHREASPGLTDVMLGTASLTDAMRATSTENLHVITSGPLPSSPAALLNSRRMADLIEEMREHADVIIFDTPPAMAVADAVLLSPKMDATVMVVQEGKVSVRVIAEVRRMILQARGNLAGVVMNRMNPRTGSYYSHYIHEDYNGDQDGTPEPVAGDETPAALPS